uniref:Uncharacterized protein n=1 Tax=Echinococcus granulosus TaxID=6210 RepID=A0A068WHG6_ECHGR|nr:hypothetical protein EgrG_000977200 [Echinococcus granulosus]
MKKNSACDPWGIESPYLVHNNLNTSLFYFALLHRIDLFPSAPECTSARNDLPILPLRRISVRATLSLSIFSPF